MYYGSAGFYPRQVRSGYNTHAFSRGQAHREDICLKCYQCYHRPTAAVYSHRAPDCFLDYRRCEDALGIIQNCERLNFGQKALYYGKLTKGQSFADGRDESLIRPDTKCPVTGVGEPNNYPLDPEEIESHNESPGGTRTPLAPPAFRTGISTYRPYASLQRREGGYIPGSEHELQCQRLDQPRYINRFAGCHGPQHRSRTKYHRDQNAAPRMSKLAQQTQTNWGARRERTSLQKSRVHISMGTLWNLCRSRKILDVRRPSNRRSTWSEIHRPTCRCSVRH